MNSSKANIIVQLQRDIQHLQGLKPAPLKETLHLGLASLEAALPHHAFPTGAVHEFISMGPEQATATSGFVIAVLSALMQKGGIILWISACRNLFPPGVKNFGIDPHQVVFIDLKKEKDILWAAEEALKCNGLAGVVAELPEISFTATRRLQLAVEQSRVTGFILRTNPRKTNVTACLTRWKISSLPSSTEDELPGIGHPRWQVDLLKVRSGKPGSWRIEWRNGQLAEVQWPVEFAEQQHKKAV